LILVSPQRNPMRPSPKRTLVSVMVEEVLDTENGLALLADRLNMNGQITGH
jgi:hypothetical protein